MFEKLKKQILKQKQIVYDDRSEEEKEVDRICFFKALNMDDFRKTLDQMKK